MNMVWFPDSCRLFVQMAELIVVSPLRRTLQTASAVSPPSIAIL
jgi:hypothetical protein